MEMKPKEYDQWKRRLLNEINTERFSTMLRDNELLSDEVSRFINNSLIHWKNGDEWYLWFRFPKVIFLVGEYRKEVEELFQIIVEKGNEINIESLKGRVSDEIVEYLQENKLQHWKINLDKLNSLFLRLISGNTEVYKDDIIHHTLAGPDYYFIPQNSLIQNKQIYLLSSREEYLNFNKLIINNNVDGDITTLFLGSLEDYLDFACSVTLDILVKFGWIITDSELKNSVLQYYQAEVNNGYFRGFESIKRLQNFICMHLFIPDRAYPWCETDDDQKEWMTISGYISSKKGEELKIDNADMERRRLREALMRGDGYPTSVKEPGILHEEGQKAKISKQMGIHTSDETEVSNFRKMLADQLRKGETVYVTSSGNIQTDEEANLNTLVVPSEKLA